MIPIPTPANLFDSGSDFDSTPNDSDYHSSIPIPE